MTSTQIAGWKGTKIEFDDLTAAVSRNSRESQSDGGEAPLPCDLLCPHRMLGEQATLDRLLFFRRIQERLWSEEHLGNPPSFPDVR